MFFSQSHIQFTKELDINNSQHNIDIMLYFSKKYIDKMKNEKINIKDVYEKSIIYSKYYLYYKTLNCIYEKDIMDILLFVDN
jgi:hypothetical protein